MDSYEWTDDEGTWCATAETAEEYADVFELIPRDDPRKRSAASALGAGKAAKPPAAREILRLAEEVERLSRELKEHTHCAADGEVLMLYNSADTAEFRRVGADDERARIRRELLADLDNAPGGGEDGESIDLTWTDLRNLVNRICPE